MKKSSARPRAEGEDIPKRERRLTMYQEITPIPVRPWTLNGLSERLIVSHYENNDGAVAERRTP
jgi:hypothetical protein